MDDILNGVACTGSQYNVLWFDSMNRVEMVVEKGG